jgi:hypothetical protein
MEKITRKDYLDNSKPLATHRRYYGQYVQEWVKDAVKRHIGEDRIINSSDVVSFNDIPLREWDILATPLSQPIPNGSSVHDLMAELGDYPTLAGMVSIYKEAARQIYDEYIEDLMNDPNYVGSHWHY